MEEDAFARITAAVAIGGTAFIERLRKRIPKRAGGLGVQAVAKACGRMGEKVKSDKRLQKQLAIVRRALEGGAKG